MDMEKQIRAEVLQDTRDLFRALSFVQNLHQSVMALLTDLAKNGKSGDEDFLNAITSATDEMAVADEVLGVFRKKLDERLEELGDPFADRKH